MNDKKLKVLIVGAGFMGEVHARAYRCIEDVEIFGIVDKNEVKGERFSDEFNCPKFNDISEGLLADVDFVDVCLPTLYHRDVVIESFKAGKDVICEKPVSLSVEEAEQIYYSSQKYGRKLMIAHVVRFWPEYFKLADMIKNNEIGDIKQITFSRYGAPPGWSEGNWMLSDSKSGGIIFDLTIHDIDYSISLFGMPEWVFARRSMAGDGYTAYVNAILGYKDLNVLLESGFIMSGGYPFTTGFRLSTGDISLEYVNKNKKGLIKYSADTAEQKLKYEDFDPYEKELRYFIECIRKDVKPLVGSGEDAVKAVKLAKYIEMSAKNNEKVEVV